MNWSRLDGKPGYIEPENIVGETLRRRDALLAHRKRCRKAIFNCPKCALLRVHEDLADLKNGLKFAKDAGVKPEHLFREMLGVIAGGT